jgi:hypothetical protein
MNRSQSSKLIARRAVLAGAGLGAAGMLLRPLHAAEAGPPPTRLLIVHRPCGTVLSDFFPPAGDAKNFTLAPIIKSFEPLKSEMVIVNGINCPRDPGWGGDQHSAGLIAMMSGKKFVPIPGTVDPKNDPNAKNIVAADKTIDQMLLASVPGLQGSALDSIQATAYRSSSSGLPSFKVMSYGGSNLALFAESRPDVLFSSVFGSGMAGLTPEQIARLSLQNKSVLDRINQDLARLQGLIPASQKPKLDAHLAGLQALQKTIDNAAASGGSVCEKPTLAALPPVPSGITQDEAQHLVVAQNQLAIIQTAFQCDLTRVATFTFAHGNSDLRFHQIDPATVKDGGGHHGISHIPADTTDQGRIDQIYCEQFSAFLQKMKTVKEGAGTLLDNTLVVFLNECAIGNTHSIENMPVLMFGGKSLGLQTGQHLNFGGRYMNDIWAAVAGAFGAPASFGDPAFGKGPVSGLFA